MKKGDKLPYLLWANKRTIKQNKNVICIFLGPTGSGKTYAALDFAVNMAEINNTEFTIENNVAFNYADLLRKVNLDCNEKPGTCFLIEEIGAVGSGGSSHEWQSKANQFLSSFMQTARHRNQILIFTTPNFSLLSKQLRQLVHLTAEMLYVNPSEKCSVAKVKIAQTNPMTGKIYLKYLRVKIEGETKAVKRVKFKLPPDDILKLYEIEKRKFTDELNKKILDFHEQKEGKTSKKERKKPNSMSEVDYERYKDKGLTDKEIAGIFNVTTRTVARIKSKLTKDDIKNDDKVPNFDDKIPNLSRKKGFYAMKT